MKYLVSLSLSFFLFAATGLNAQKIDFTEIKSEADWNNVLAMAASQDKPVFLDIYATWCGPCKQMDALVFASADVAEFYNEKYINTKIDGESEFGLKLVNEFQLRGYPTMYYLGSDKFLYSKLVGFRQPQVFLDFGKKVDENKTNLRTYTNAFEQGTLIGEDVKNYLDLLTQLDDKDRLAELSGLYINSLSEEDISNPANKGLILNSDLKFESEVFRRILDNPTQFSELWGEEEYQNFLEKVFIEALHRAAEDKNEEFRDKLGNELMSVYFRNDPESIIYGKFLTRKLYHAINEDWEIYISEIEEYYKNEKLGDMDFLVQEIYQILRNQYSSPELLEAASTWVAIIIETAPTFEPFYLGSIIYAYLANTEKANEMIAQAEKLAEGEEIDKLEAVRKYLNEIEEID
jgi:thiol-disulfide isomerase/thioredoxin